MKKLFTISVLLICLSASLMQAGGYCRIKLTKKGSELQAEIQKAIGVESTVEIRDHQYLPYWAIATWEGMCQLQIIHPDEIMVFSYTVENETQFNEINDRLSPLFEPYRMEDEK